MMLGGPPATNWAAHKPGTLLLRPLRLLQLPSSSSCLLITTIIFSSMEVNKDTCLWFASRISTNTLVTW